MGGWLRPQHRVVSTGEPLFLRAGGGGATFSLASRPHSYMRIYALIVHVSADVHLRYFSSQIDTQMQADS